MPAYHYLAINLNGDEQKGVIEAESEKHARQLLRDKSFLPLQIRSVTEKKGINKEKKFTFTFQRRRLTSKELALMTSLTTDRDRSLRSSPSEYL